MMSPAPIIGTNIAMREVAFFATHPTRIGT